jgi:hypothetical protein
MPPPMAGRNFVQIYPDTGKPLVPSEIVFVLGLKKNRTLHHYFITNTINDGQQNNRHRKILQR